MHPMILSGTRINDCDQPGAVIYDHDSDAVLQHVFADQWEAQDFIEFCVGEYRRVPFESVDMALVAWRHDRKAVSCG